jgi:uncharacterized cupin superfamily protein
VETFNVFGDDWDTEVERPGGRFGDTPIGPRLGAELLGASLYELPPGGKGWPYHWHHGNEELLVVVAGTPTLRAPAGERALEPGDCVLFLRGPEGAHTLRNDTESPARFLVFSTRVSPEMVTYPDSGKLAAGSRFGRGIFREETAVDYWAGEQ